jgi:hypothetical protein
LIHLETGYKADIYLAGAEPLHAWALPLHRRVPWNDQLGVSVAPPEYVVLRKLEFFREGRSSKHPADIRAIRDITGVDEAALRPWLEKQGLTNLWQEIAADHLY